MGGWLYVGGENLQPTTGGYTPGQNLVFTVKGGTIEEIIGGSYVKVSSNGTKNFSDLKTVEFGNITTTIDVDESTSGTATEFVVGGSKIANDKSGA